MLAVSSGTRAKPSVKLAFGYDNVHRRTKEPLCGWVEQLPAREWNKGPKTWMVTAVPEKARRDFEAIFAAAGVVVGPDGEPTSQPQQLHLADQLRRDAAAARMTIVDRRLPMISPVVTWSPNSLGGPGKDTPSLTPRPGKTSKPAPLC